MKQHFYKYQGTGNDFIIFDGKKSKINFTIQQIKRICDRRFGIGGDGVMILENSKSSDFKMVYFNSDGKESSMCGNGGRCIVQFANQQQYIKEKTIFQAIDGLHAATIIDQKKQIVSLKMNDVTDLEITDQFICLNTGSPHLVRFVENANEINIVEVGRSIRNSHGFREKGINVNFVERKQEDLLYIRTYERGVEDETLSCGTGVTASVLAAVATGKIPDNGICKVLTPGGPLSVRYFQEGKAFNEIYLVGPANFVFEGDIEL